MSDKPTYEELENQIAKLKKQNEISNIEKHYRLLFDNSIDGFAYHRMIYENDIPIDYIFLAVNPAFENLTSLKNVTGRKVTDIIPDINEENSELFKIYGSVATTGKPQKIEVYFAPLKTWFSISATCPEKGYFIAIFDDISDRKLIEQELKENEILLNETGKLAKVGGWKIDLQTQQLTWSREVYRIHEVPNDYQPTVEDAINFYDSNSKEIIEKAVNDAIQLGKPFDIDLGIITAKGNKLQVKALGKIQNNTNGEPEIIYGTFQNITEQKLIERALKESEERFNLAIQATEDGIWDWNIETNLEYFSPKFCEIIGFSFDDESFEHTYQNWAKRIHPDDYDMVMRKLNSHLNEDKPYNVEYRHLNSSGVYRWQNSTGKAIKNNDGKPIRMVGRIKDITEIKQTELNSKQQNEELKKLNADKDRFMRILAHDLKSPFNSLLGFSDLLFNNLHKYDIGKIEKQIGIINQIANKTFILLEDLLMWFNSQSGKLTLEPQKMVFSEICADILNSMKHQAVTKGVSINFCNSEKIELSADVNMIKTILRNLISNAIKFTNQNGQINIYAEKNNQDNIITVSDNGVGIENENLIKLWDFATSTSTNGTADEKGTGFGLLLCKEFVIKHGGKIWVESELGKGSDFKFSIPNKQITKTVITDLPIAQTENANVILVAEDELYNFLLIEELLSDMDLKLIHVQNGKEAIEAINSNFDIALILMDIKMPIMDGYTAAKQIKEVRPNMPIIAQSAYVDGGEKAKYGNNTFDDYISKPINPVEFKQKVLKYISKQLSD